MQDNDRTRDGDNRAQSEKAPVGTRVLAQCEGFRCLAYRANDGRLLGAFTHQELKNVIQTYPLE